MKTTLLKLSEIVTTAGTQVRSCIDTSTVDDYATAMVEGAKFPPVAVFHDGSQYILADGFHRVMAATRNHFEEIEAQVQKGTKSDALKFALKANAEHGLPRTQKDKRRSVVLALAEWPKFSDREIARICAVGNALVGEVRRSESMTQVFESNTCKRVGGDGKEYTVKNKPAQSTEKPEPKPIETLQAGPQIQSSNEQGGGSQPTNLTDEKWKQGLGLTNQAAIEANADIMALDAFVKRIIRLHPGYLARFEVELESAKRQVKEAKEKIQHQQLAA